MPIALVYRILNRDVPINRHRQVSAIFLESASVKYRRYLPILCT